MRVQGVKAALASLDPALARPDCCSAFQGYLYQLDAHLQRFFTSAKKAGLLLPFPPAQIRRTILETAAASKKMHGVLCC